MGFLKGAFNAVTRLHSQAGYIKRSGTPNLYSPMRITPSNFFRYTQGPSLTVITGSEGIIPVSAITGTQVQTVAMSGTPVALSSFKLTYDGHDTSDLDWDTVTASDIQVALRLIAGLESVVVTGPAPFSIKMFDVQTPVLLVGVPPASGVITVGYGASVAIDPPIKRGDRLIIGSQMFSAKEIIEMPDLGGEIIGYRVRYE